MAEGADPFEFGAGQLQFRGGWKFTDGAGHRFALFGVIRPMSGLVARYVTLNIEKVVKSATMIPRQAEPLLREKLATTPAVVLRGPRQVGKTTLARSLAGNWPGGVLYLDLERPADRLRLDDADGYLRAQHGKLVILDASSARDI